MTIGKLVGLTGYAGSGKDTFAKSLRLRGAYERVGFADAVKEMALVLDPYILIGSTVGKGYDFVLLSDIVRQVGWDEAKKIGDVRVYLQKLGTDAVREIINKDAWVMAAQSKIWPLITEGTNVVVTDVRFQNEADLIRSWGGKVFRVERPGFAPVNDHISDVGIDSIAVDGVVLNDGTVDDLGREASRIIAAMEG